MIYTRRSLQKVFKIFFQILFKTIYGKVKYNSENLENNNVLIDKVKNHKIKTIDDKSYCVYTILNGRVYMDKRNYGAVKGFVEGGRLTNREWQEEDLKKFGKEFF